MKITWYGHSCFLVETDSGSAVFDPYAPGSVPGLTLPKLCADAVFCSHLHSDHSYAQGVTLTGLKPSFAVTQIPTFHDEKHGALRGENTVTLIEAEGIRLVHLGDLGHELSREQIYALGRVDVLLVPVGGYYTIDAKAAHNVAVSLRAKIVIPMHYRGDGFGYGVIAENDAFLALSENVTWFKTNFVELSSAAEPMTAVLQCPV